MKTYLLQSEVLLWKQDREDENGEKLVERNKKNKGDKLIKE